jgi:hypothetical protein
MSVAEGVRRGMASSNVDPPQTGSDQHESAQIHLVFALRSMELTS